MPLLHQEVTIGCLVRTNLSKIKLIHLRASALLPVNADTGDTRAKRQNASLRVVKLEIATVGNLTGRQLPSQLPEDGHGLVICKIEKSSNIYSKSNFAYRRSHERIDGARRGPIKQKLVVHAALRFLCNNVQQRPTTGAWITPAAFTQKYLA